MNDQNHLFEKYLNHLNVEKKHVSLKALAELQTAQIIKFPFENISKLLLWEKGYTKELIDFETHLDNSIEFNCGGTCYANNYYFNSLLKYLGYDATLHGANMGKSIDVHLVNIVKIENKRYLVDVGYGAPFYKPIPLDGIKPFEINWSVFKYVLTNEPDNRHKITVYKNGTNVHHYIINKEKRNIKHFREAVQNSFRGEAEFMNRLRLIKYFDDYSIELSNMKYTIHKDGSSFSHTIKNVDELEYIVHNKFDLPKLPIRKAYSILTEKKKINLFEDSKKSY
ncbi:MAG: arylamine N-acetyltransferase [Ignavibacteria bacterium]|jgi:arylamine N-acetyltransferase